MVEGLLSAEALASLLIGAVSFSSSSASGLVDQQVGLFDVVHSWCRGIPLLRGLAWTILAASREVVRGR